MSKYVVALSGGADSVCLLLTLIERGEVGVVAHCNFHLRGEESNRDELFVSKLCKERGVELLIKHFDTLEASQERGERVEMTARRLRYDWFSELVNQYHLDGVAVGHHQEDNAETILLNIARGTGLQGLTGMQTFGSNGQVRIYRPLLGVSKKQILNYLQLHKQSFVTDSTNTDVHYKRNRIRHNIIPELQQLNPQFVQAINGMAHRLSAVSQIYQLKIREMAQQCDLSVLRDYSGYQQISVEKLLSTGQATTILHELLSPLAFTATQIANILEMKVGGVVTSAQGIATRSEKMIIFGTQITKTANQPLLLPKNRGETAVTCLPHCKIEATFLQRKDLATLRCSQSELLIDVDALSGELSIRSVEMSDKFCPFGMKGSQLLSNYMTNRHLSRIEKMLSLVVKDDEGILWLVGQRGDERTRITDKTHHVLHLKYISE